MSDQMPKDTESFELAIRQILSRECGYSARAAKVTAHDLAHFSSPEHEDLDEAVDRWVRDRADRAVVRSGGYDTRLLAGRGLAYPAALVFLDWYRCDPVTASRALDAGAWEQ